MLVIMIFDVAAGLLLAGLALPLIWRKVGPNPWYGFRVRQTLEDPEVWYPVNAFAGKALLCVGLLTSLTAVTAYLIPNMNLATYATIVGIIVLSALVVCVGASFCYLAVVVHNKTKDPSGRN